MITITNEGKKLSAIIRDRIFLYVTTGTAMADLVSCLTCSVPENTMGIRTYNAIAEGMRDYFDNFSYVETTLEGYALNIASTTPTGVIITSANDDIKMHGNMELNTSLWFNIAASPMTITDTPITDDPQKPRAAFNEFLNVFVKWMTFPTVKTKSSKFIDKAYVIGDGIVTFNITEATRTAIQNSANESFDAVTAKKLEPSVAFIQYWDITSSAILEMLTNNTVVSQDSGYAFFTAPPFVAKSYSGMSRGKVIFTDKQRIRYDITVVDLSSILPVFPKIELFGSIEIGNIFPTLKLKDRDGNDVDLNPIPAFGKIIGDLATVGDQILTTVQKAIADMYDTVCSDIRDLNVDTSGIIEWMKTAENAVGTFVDAIIKAIIDSFNFVTDVITGLITRVVSALVKEVLVKITPYGTAIAYVMSFNELKTEFEKLNGLKKGIQESVDAVVNGISTVVDNVNKSVKTVTDFIDKNTEQLQKCSSYCGAFMDSVSQMTTAIQAVTVLAEPVKAVGQVISTIPTLPEIPDATNALVDKGLGETNSGLPDDQKLTKDQYMKQQSDDAAKSVKPPPPPPVPTPPTPQIPSANTAAVGTFEHAYYITRQLEGGYSNSRYDRGGVTNKGVTHATYDEYRKLKGQPLRSVRLITETETQEIYRKFWTASKAETMAAESRDSIFDAHFNMGVSGGKNLLKKATQAQSFDFMYTIAQAMTDLKTKFNNTRLEFYKKLAANDADAAKNLKGWTARVNYFQK